MRAGILKNIILIITVSVLAAGPVRAQTVSAPEAPLSLHALIERGLKDNPRLRAAEYRYEAAKARVGLLRNLPDPEVGYEENRIIPAMVNGSGARPMKTVSVTQKIPFPTKLFLKEAAAKREADALEQEYEETRQALVKDIKEAYFDLFLNERKVALTEDNVTLMDQFVAVASKKYAANMAGQQDVLRAQVEYAKLSNQRTLFRQEARIARARLASLLGQQEDVAVDLSDDRAIAKDLELSESDVADLAKAHRPELLSFASMLEKSGIDLKLSKQGYLPDVTLGYKRADKRGEIGAGEWAGSVAVSIPLWFWGKQNREVREARADLEAAKAQYAAVADTVVFEAKSALARFKAAQNMVNVYETGILPQAEAAVKTSQRAYEAGTMDFLDLLDAWRTWHSLRIEYFKARADLETAFADLERSVGTSISKEEEGS